MLASVQRPDGSEVTFKYDPLGRRVSKTYRGQTTRWVWDGNVPLHEWVEGRLVTLAAANGVRWASADLSMQKREAELEVLLARGPPSRGSKTEPITWLFEPESFSPMAKLCAGETQSILCDHLGTPVLMVDGAGSRVWSASLSVYGELRDLEGERSACPFRWPGQYEDPETGLYYNRFRYYDAESGQYCSQDPIGLAGGARLYGYAHDPLAWIDPLGLSCQLKEKQDAAAAALAPLKAAFPDEMVGFRGSLARGKKGPHKGGAPFDPTNFDVDAFIVSDRLAGVVPPNRKGFRGLNKLPEHRGLLKNLDTRVQRIAGVRNETFSVRIFSHDEFARKVGSDERYLVR